MTLDYQKYMTAPPPEEEARLRAGFERLAEFCHGVAAHGPSLRYGFPGDAKKMLSAVTRILWHILPSGFTDDVDENIHQDLLEAGADRDSSLKKTLGGWE